MFTSRRHPERRQDNYPKHGNSRNCHRCHEDQPGPSSCPTENPDARQEDDGRSSGCREKKADAFPAIREQALRCERRDRGRRQTREDGHSQNPPHDSRLICPTCVRFVVRADEDRHTQTREQDRNTGQAEGCLFYGKFHWRTATPSRTRAERFHCPRQTSHLGSTTSAVLAKNNSALNRMSSPKLSSLHASLSASRSAASSSARRIYENVTR